jgi:predicted transposase YdaD
VKTDLPIKVLFERQGQSLLPFVGEQGARLAGVDVVEVPAGSRTVDCVLRLERDGLTWYRHLEFQAERDPDIPRRCFEYNARLVLHYSATVVTTVVYLLRGADRDVADAFRLYIGTRLVNEWRFDVVRLWEIEADLALAAGTAGPLGLVPLLGGGDRPAVIRKAVRRLAALPSRRESADVMAVLIDLACQRYDRGTIQRLFRKDSIMQSWLYQMGRDEGEAKGEARGQLISTRTICADLVKVLHPRVASRILRRIEACADPDTLRGWILECPKLSDAAFVTLVSGKRGSGTARSRVSRPARAAGRSVASGKRR